MDNKEGRPTPDYLLVAAATAAAVAAGVSCVSLPVLAATAESAHSQLLLDQMSLPSMFHIVRRVLGQQPAPCYSSFSSTSSQHNYAGARGPRRPAGGPAEPGGGGRGGGGGGGGGSGRATTGALWLRTAT